MMWAASYQGRWREALTQSTRLRAESKWSPCLYSYLQAAHYCMLADLTPAEVEEQRKLMEAVPGLKQRIAGDSIPLLL